MKLKLAKKNLSEKKFQTITIEEIEANLKEQPQQIIYLDSENDHKDLVALVDHFSNEGLSVHLKEVKFGLAEGEYVYEFWII
jgi:predicted PilT family ATPase